MKITIIKLTFRKKHNPKDQSEETHFVTAGRNWIFLWPFAALRSSPERELASPPDHSSTPGSKVTKIWGLKRLCKFILSVDCSILPFLEHFQFTYQVTARWCILTVFATHGAGNLHEWWIDKHGLHFKINEVHLNKLMKGNPLKYPLMLRDCIVFLQLLCTNNLLNVFWTPTHAHTHTRTHTHTHTRHHRQDVPQ